MNEEWKSLNIADVPKGEYELEKVTKDVTHCCIYTPNDVADILPLKDPEIRIEKVF
ncbi:hypothetical protein DOK67_0003156 [Enterococcus sp. DIV0212c]|uniref:hypothetical protein n=1 Tax=Enterococcus sp. DIV0212c TaxID=2230867 RepID=UPI001A9BD401|nr:hypothetical protein [Enterococcus sp. DIV0212c]MBO1355110.1 hypothetical protein [Enterococcus sp. DIV0212c]